jgi:hypothetical protein
MIHLELQQVNPKKLAWYQVWFNAIIQPSIATFEHILADPQAMTGRAYQWLAFSSLIAPIIGFVVSLVVEILMTGQVLSVTIICWSFGLLMRAFIGVPFIEQVDFTFDCLGGLVVALIGISFLGILGVLISSALTQFVARELGGQGTYGQLFYTQAAYTAPLGIVLAAVIPMPYINLLSLPFFYIYTFILNVMALQAVNRFGLGPALVAAFTTTGIIVGLLIGCSIILFFFVLLPFAMVDR